MVAQKSEPLPHSAQAAATVALGKGELRGGNVALDAEGERGTRSVTWHLREDVARPIHVTRLQQPLHCDEPRRIAWVVAKDRTGHVAMLGGHERRRGSAACSRPGDALPLAHRRQRGLKLQDAGKDCTRRIADAREVSTCLPGQGSGLAVPLQSDEAARAVVLGLSAIEAKSCSGELGNRLDQEFLGIGEEAALEEHLGAAQQGDAVPLIGGESRCPCHVRQCARYVPEQVLGGSDVVKRERHEERMVERHRVRMGGLVVRESGGEVAELHVSASSIEKRRRAITMVGRAVKLKSASESRERITRLAGPNQDESVLTRHETSQVWPTGRLSDVAGQTQHLHDALVAAGLPEYTGTQAEIRPDKESRLLFTVTSLHWVWE
ncbi:hypothetical protein [Antribacter soli]|uniref:hypothetical protein n=1 Tax=Antribacter soli TaxID=2910976 RepID=UPI003FD73C4E